MRSSRTTSLIETLRSVALASTLMISGIGLQAQPVVNIGLYASTTPGVVDVRLKADGDFSQLLSNLLFTISWPASAGGSLDDAGLVSLCPKIPIVPNGDGLQVANGRRYQTYFMLGFESLNLSCPMVAGQELTVMRIRMTGNTSCADLQIANDGYTAANNKDYYVSLNGADRTGITFTSNVSICPCVPGVMLHIATDDHPEQISYEFRSATDGSLVTSGNLSAGQANRVVHESICLPPGCYRLKVMDSGGNGISGGAYVLMQGGSRIIDATGEFGSVSAIKDDGSFCLPLGPAMLKPTSCDLTDIGTNDILNAKKVTGATAYTFWIFDPHGSYDTTIVRNGPKLKITPGIASQLPMGLDMNVRVNAQQGGVFGAFGKTCRARFGAAPGMALGVDELYADEDEGLVVFPNPLIDGTFQIGFGRSDGGSQQAVIELFTMSGQLLSRREVAFQGRMVQAMSLPDRTAQGLYMVAVTMAEGRFVKLLVQP